MPDAPASSESVLAPSRWGWRYGRIALVLALLIPLTWGARLWRLDAVRATIEARQADAATAALAYVERDFEALLGAMTAEAKALAETPVVVAHLRALGRGEEGGEALARHFTAHEVPPLGAIELYDPSPRLVAWNGYSMPLSTLPGEHRFLEAYQTGVALDEDRRVAFEVWWPVREGSRPLGVVRVLRMVHFDVPVRNQYLRDYSLAEEWSRATRETVSVDFAPGAGGEAPTVGLARLLQGIDGAVLARVVVAPPAAEVLVEAVAHRFTDVMAFWATLLAGWLLAGLWHAYRQAEARLSDDPRSLARAVGWWSAAAIGWWGLRYGLLALGVPARWQTGKSPFAPLFDPTHLASTFGAGLMRSSGDLLLTACFALVFAAAFVRLATRRPLPVAAAVRRPGRQALARRAARAGFLRNVIVMGGAVLAICGLVALLALITRHALLDSTLGYFTRSGLLPERLVLVVFFALLLMTLSVALLSVGLVRAAVAAMSPMRRSGRWLRVPMAPVIVASGLGLGLVYLGLGMGALVPWAATLAFFVVGLVVTERVLLSGDTGLGLLSLRSVLPSVFALALLLYPLVYRGLDARQQLRLRDAAESFDEGRDPRVLFALEQVLHTAGADEALGTALADDAARTTLDALAARFIHGSLLASLGAYDVSVTVFDAAGQPRARSLGAESATARAALDERDALEFGILRDMYAESAPALVMVDMITGRRQRDRPQYIGFAPITAEEGAGGWLLARAEPQLLPRAGMVSFPRVLAPAGFYGNLYADLSLAEFRDGVLVRSAGRNFGRSRLSTDVRQALRTAPVLWRRETVKEDRYLTYYWRRDEPASGAEPTGLTIIAVRVASINLFDHLYYLLRLTVAGLFLGLPVYLLGLSLRRQRGLLPAQRVKFRDKVLNAFLAVGIITVAAMGLAGLKVVTGENERAIQSWLRQHLERVEETLAREAIGDELPYRVLERTPVDSLAAQVGLDLNIYKGAVLVASSVPQLTRDRLIDERMPARAYQDLYFDGFRFTTTEERVGGFAYTAGFRALFDERGLPRFVIALPTLPEQERIEEERARTVAYLFGALLVLMLVVMFTAAVFANALTRPIERLRAGMQAAARSRFDERIPPVKTRDEIGELVQAFNEMQTQLAESRRELARQERQLAWREMARQVAHEIKNPLTPMKLSVQHLQRAYDGLDATDGLRTARFQGLFQRITSTLSEQIDALARIADEFSTFARMPRRVLEPLDLNVVLREAVALMQEEAHAEIFLDLGEAPLVLEADREELRRIYINLIKNGLQAVPDDNGPARIDITSERFPGPDGTPGFAYTTVTDNGTGIPDALHEKIFEPNFSTKTSGTGLGLAIVKKGIEDLHGEIGFETEASVGTTFWIRLPLTE